MATQQTDTGVITAYKDFYQHHDEAWRMLGAKYKARHIIEVCKGLTFTKVLEVGAGDGSVLKMLSESKFAAAYYAVEISESGVDYIRSRKIEGLQSVEVFDGYHLPFKDDEFDLVILSHVLEHVEHERLLLRELKRVAKMCVIEVPRDYKYNVDSRIKHFLAYGHINVYTPSLIRYMLLTEGFNVVSDLTSMIEPEVTRFNRYVNQKKPKSSIADFKITLEYGVKNMLSKLLGKEMQEKLANAYTVLCKKEDKTPTLF
jgi:ubiquinone/menaquinone biosynthesis C-methylase UbiE